MTNTRKVTVCAVPYEMTIVEGGVLFSNKSGFSGTHGRYMFEYKSSLWYLTELTSTWKATPVCHIVKMHKLLALHIGPDHTEADGTRFQLEFRDTR